MANRRPAGRCRCPTLRAGSPVALPAAGLIGLIASPVAGDSVDRLPDRGGEGLMLSPSPPGAIIVGYLTQRRASPRILALLPSRRPGAASGLPILSGFRFPWSGVRSPPTCSLAHALAPPFVSHFAALATGALGGPPPRVGRFGANCQGACPTSEAPSAGPASSGVPGVDLRRAPYYGSFGPRCQDVSRNSSVF